MVFGWGGILTFFFLFFFYGILPISQVNKTISIHKLASNFPYPMPVFSRPPLNASISFFPTSSHIKCDIPSGLYLVRFSSNIMCIVHKWILTTPSHTNLLFLIVPLLAYALKNFDDTWVYTTIQPRILIIDYIDVNIYLLTKNTIIIHL